MNAQYTFETFVSGASNSLALKLARAAADAPAAPLAPVYLHGPAACGKSHLLYAVKNRISRNFPEMRVICIKCDDFTGELIQSMRHGHTRDFRESYRKADVLLMDDIQFLEGKEATQQEFLTLFHILLDSGKQVVLTSTRPLEKLPILKEAALFAEAEILPPDLETKLAAASCKATEYKLTLSEAVLLYLANQADNIRQIEGALKRILVHRELGSFGFTQANILKMLEEEWLPTIQKTPIVF